MMRKPSERTRVRRIPNRGAYDRASIDGILDEGIVAHVAFVVDGQPFVIPTLYARDGDRVLIHGSAASRLLNTLDQGADACLTVTLADGLVVARSAFHSSMNYRSVMMLGHARVIQQPAAKLNALRMLVEHLIPGRWDDCRQPNEREIKATLILELPIDEASAKIRTGGPIDDEADYQTSYWAGVLPFLRDTAEPSPDERLAPGIPLPDYLRGNTRRKP